MDSKIREEMTDDFICLDTDLSWMKDKMERTDKCLLLIGRCGTATLLVGDEEYMLDNHRVVLLRPDLPFKLLGSSKDFRVTMLGFSIITLHQSTQRIEPRFFLFIYTKVLWTLKPEHREVLNHFCSLFRFAASRYGRGYSVELVNSLVTALVFGAHEMLENIPQEIPFEDSSRSRELFRNFMELLSQNYKREHEVQFYAKELCISSKYLTQITRRTIGQTPKHIIDSRLLLEAMKLLEKNNSSIQDISRNLGFPDQSYFGRFFKRMKQMSPQQYRLSPKS